MGDLYPEYEKIIRDALMADQKKRSEEIENLLKESGTSLEKIDQELKKYREEGQ